MPTTHATNSSQLQRRIRRYLEATGLRERADLREKILPLFVDIGPTVIIGGMLRDLARKGWQGFSSDVDLVIQPHDYGRFVALMDSAGGIRNRFGGYGLRLGDWRVDVWALSDTWARRAGYRKVEQFDDLLECTFFDYDAVLYDVGRRKVIVRSDYFERLSHQVLDINLVENPNAIGAAVRTLRRALAWDVRLSANLADYVLDVLAARGWQAVVELEARAFHQRLLAGEEHEEMVRCLQGREIVRDRLVSMRLAKRPEQLEFAHDLVGSR